MMIFNLYRPTLVLAGMCVTVAVLAGSLMAQQSQRAAFTQNAVSRSANTASRYVAARAPASESPWFEVQVELEKVEVLDDGDPGSYLAGGELYWRIAVRHSASNHQTDRSQAAGKRIQQLILSEVNRAQCRSVRSGKSYGIKQLDQSATVRRFRVKRGGLFWVDADFKEADQLSADDLMQPVKPASPLSVYRPILPGALGSEIVREYRFTHADRAAVRLHFKVTAAPTR